MDEVAAQGIAMAIRTGEVNHADTISQAKLPVEQISARKGYVLLATSTADRAYDRRKR